MVSLKGKFCLLIILIKGRYFTHFELTTMNCSSYSAARKYAMICL